MKKKIMSLLLVVCLVVTMIPFATMEANAASSDGGKWLWPVQPTNVSTYSKNYKSRVTCAYGSTDGGGVHKAIDISPTGSTKKILATRSGKVVRAEYHYSLGNYVTIRHSGGYYSIYAHLKSDNVYAGQSVKQGAVIGTMGNTGQSSGTHLHFQINKNCIDGIGRYDSARKSYTVNTNPSKLPYFFTTAQSTYTVKYSANGGTGTMSSATATLGKSYASKSNAFKRTGYTFGGWYVKKNNKYWLVKSGSSWKWSTSSSNRKVYSNKYGFKFYNSGSTNQKVNKGDTITLYARWVPKTYSVTYNANGGSGAPGAQTKTYGKTLTLSSVKPVRDGYEFVGWSTSRSASAAQYKAGSKYTANKAAVLYAVWEKDGFFVTEDEYRAKYSNTSKYAATPYYRYQTRTKNTTTSTSASLSGWTRVGSKTTYKYGGWSQVKPSGGYESVSTYYYYTYVCKCQRLYWKSKNSDICSNCGTNAKNLLRVYSKNNPALYYKKDTDGSYFTPKKIVKSSPGSFGTIYRISFNGNSVTAFTSTSLKNTSFLWPSSAFKVTLYRSKTATTTYSYERWSAWSGWSAWTKVYKSNSDTINRDSEVRYYIEKK